ncbi:MAG: gamma-glutamylcyclotransferase family protein, partial [Bacillota bacterium]|nr:gamma-glutamylcyclotransferase family protein [Bacillota bacterium]
MTKPQAGDTHYFAYGSNLHMRQMQERCEDSVPMMRVKLKNYQLLFDGVATIVPAPGKTVWGALYRVSSEDIRHLDIYEGYPRLYRKET